MNVSNKSLITVKEAAAMLGVTPLTIRNWDKAGKLTALRHPLNNYRVYKRADIEALVRLMEAGSEPIYKPATGRKKSRLKLDVKHEE